MEITEVTVKPVPGHRQGSKHRPLLAVCSVVFDHVFVIHEIKIIGGSEPLIIDMPSRKTLDRCICGTRNSTSSHYCNGCGIPISPSLPLDANGKPMHRVSMSHPIDNTFRTQLEAKIRNEAAVVLSGSARPCPDSV